MEVSERRTAKDLALAMKRLVDELYPQAETIRLVLDNLNTHTPAALYGTFEPAEARRIARKLEFHYTPLLTHPGSTRWRSSFRCCTSNVWEDGVSRTRRCSGARLGHGSESVTREERR